MGYAGNVANAPMFRSITGMTPVPLGAIMREPASLLKVGDACDRVAIRCRTQLTHSCKVGSRCYGAASHLRSLLSDARCRQLGRIDLVPCLPLGWPNLRLGRGHRR